MKKRMLISGLVVAITVLILAYANTGELSEVAAYNKSWFDTQYDFNKAIIDLRTEVITVDVKTWTDYEDGEQLQIVAKDGTVYLTSSYNCTLIKTKQ